LKLDREQNIAGAEYLNSCSVFEADVEAQFKKSIPNSHLKFSAKVNVLGEQKGV
jgi:hypothetical protein